MCSVPRTGNGVRFPGSPNKNEDCGKRDMGTREASNTNSKWKLGHSFAQKILHFSVTLFPGTELGAPLRSEAKPKAPEAAAAAMDRQPEGQISR